jgi:hypothetical protein
MVDIAHYAMPTRGLAPECRVCRLSMQKSGASV